MPQPHHTPLSSTRPALSRNHALISWLLACLALLYIGSSLFRLYQHKQQIEAQMAQQLQNLSLSMRRSLALQLGQLQTLQQLIADQISDHFPPQLADAGQQQINRLQQLLTQQAADNDDIELLGVADPNGRILYMSSNVTSVRAGEQIDISAFRGNATLDRVLTIFEGGPQSRWPSGFLLVRPVRHADGSLHAFVFALQSDDSFLRRIHEQQQRGFSLGKQAVVSIHERASNRLAFRYPSASSIIGKPIPAFVREPFRGTTADTSYITSPYDQIRRLVYEQALMDDAYILRIGAAEADYLAPWYAERVSAVISTLLLLSAVGLLLRLVRLEARQAIELQHDKAQLAIGARAMQTLIDAAPVALAQVRQHDGQLLTANPAFGQLFGALPGRGVSLATALFSDPQQWDRIASELAQDQTGEGKRLECTLQIGANLRHALVSAARLPTGQFEQPQLLLSFTDTEAQFAREQTLINIAYTDPLTRLPNRRAFFEQADAAWEVARRYQRPLSLLMIDLDHFKRVNDTYGHAAGDVVLVRTADCLRQTLRKADVPARLGGEEFVVLLPETSLSAALETAERIRQCIEREPAAEFEGQQIPVTASLGVAVLDDASQDVQALIKRADEALYQAKGSGRNRVVSAD